MKSNHKGAEPIARSWSDRFLAPFRRVTSSGSFISEIDGLRFIAIGTVVLFHLTVNLSMKSPLVYAIPTAGNIVAAIARHGFRGVELFFIISGFILACPFAAHQLGGRPPVRLRQYFLRRLTRLEPPYIVAMVTLFLLRLSVRGETFGDLFPHLAASLVYCHNLIFGTENPINNVAWSLEIEVQFYLLVPLLAGLFKIRRTALRRSVIAAIIAASIFNEWLFIGPESRLYLTIVRFLHFFLIGFLLADIYLLDWKESPAKSLRWDVVSLLGWPLLFFLWNHPELSRLFPGGNLPLVAAVGFPLLAFLLYQAVFRGPVTNRVMTNPWITTVGGMCYTIYLFHNPIIGKIVSLTNAIAPTHWYTANVALQGLLVLPLLLAASALYFVAVERPCMRRDWPRRAAERIRLMVARPALQERNAMSDRI
jgi:peptidoglycan/LPS O-acetylase OafA/YrhL